MSRYKLTIAYDGSGFHGWQRQDPPGAEPLRTVQGVLEQVLPRLLGQPIHVVGASRTDAGVHAMGQVAHFDASTRIPAPRMAEAITARLPADLAVRRAEVVRADFHAIGDAVTKQYRYRIWNRRERPLGLRHLVYHGYAALDVGAMADAAARLVGEHDFAGFAAAAHGRRSTVRTIHRSVVHRESGGEGEGEEQGGAGGEVVFTVEGDGFLYHMVRIIAGTLVEVGRGRFDPAVIDRVLQSADRRDAGPTLPPQGLCLQWIKHRGG